METIEGDAKCYTCDNTYMWHQVFNPAHPFNNGSVSFKATFGARTPDGGRTGPQRGSQGAETPPAPAMPFDPVLRQALIDAGVLTPQQLQDAEDKIRAITGQFEQSVRETNDESASRS